MIWYVIYLFTVNGFPPGGSGGYTCTEIRDSKKWETNTQNDTKTQNT